MIEQEAEKILKQVQNDRGGESGRTMTEMLAVIGIIGVLSVGGMTLGGYVIGGIKANRVVSGIQERILLAQKRRIIGQSLSFRKRRIEESIMGLYPVEYDSSAMDDTIPIYYGKKITVSEIPQQVCEGLKEDPSLQATLDEVGGIISFNDGGEDGACQEEDNTFFVLFGGRSEGECHGRNNGCMACDKASGEWVIDKTKDGEQIDICHKCLNGNIVAKEKGKVVPCGNKCCTMFETCDAEEGCVTRCPANSTANYFEGDQIGDSECYCNEGYRVDAFQTGCRSEKICDPTCESPLVCDDGKCVDSACLNVECHDGSTCSHGQCQCSNGLFVCGTKCCAEGTYCTGPDNEGGPYTCAKPIEGGDCTKNSECNEGNVDTTKYCEFPRSSCTNLGTGTCTDKDKGTLTEYTLNLPGGALTVYKSSVGMNWWSAVNLCQAHGKQMVTMSDLGVSDNGQVFCYFDSDKRVNASKDKTSQCNCIGDSDCSATKTELYKLGTAGGLWLADNGKESSCQVYYVALADGYVNDRVRTNPIYALCR